MVVEIDILKKGEVFDLFVGDDCGGSGISVTGKTADEVIENLTPYLHDYLYRMEHPEEDEDED